MYFLLNQSAPGKRVLERADQNIAVVREHVLDVGISFPP